MEALPGRVKSREGFWVILCGKKWKQAYKSFVKSHLSYRCFIQAHLDRNRSIQVVTGPSTAAGVLYSSYSQENKGGKYICEHRM